MHLTLDLPTIDLPTSAHPSPSLLLAVGVGVGMILTGLAWRSIRRWRRRQAPHPTQQRHDDPGNGIDPTTSGPDLADVLTIVAAGIATGVAAQGMWRVAGDVLHLPVVLRCLMFAFLEIAVIASAVRARRSMRERAAAETEQNSSTDPDVIAVWVLTCLSAVLSSLHSSSLSEHVARLAAPLVAAWLWERGMAVEHRRRSGRDNGIHWRLTPERIFIRLGLADSTDRTASDVDAQRRLINLALAAASARTAKRTVPRRLAQRRLTHAVRGAVAHAGLAADPARQKEMLAHLAVLVHAQYLTELPLESPWATHISRSGETMPTEQSTSAVSVTSQTVPAPAGPPPLPHVDSSPDLSVDHAATPAGGVTSSVGHAPAVPSTGPPIDGFVDTADSPVPKAAAWTWYQEQRRDGRTPTQGDFVREFDIAPSTAGRWRQKCDRTYRRRLEHMGESASLSATAPSHRAMTQTSENRDDRAAVPALAAS